MSPKSAARLFFPVRRSRRIKVVGWVGSPPPDAKAPRPTGHSAIRHCTTAAAWLISLFTAEQRTACMQDARVPSSSSTLPGSRPMSTLRPNGPDFEEDEMIDPELRLRTVRTAGKSYLRATNRREGRRRIQDGEEERAGQGLSPPCQRVDLARTCVSQSMPGSSHPEGAHISQLPASLFRQTPNLTEGQRNGETWRRGEGPVRAHAPPSLSSLSRPSPWRPWRVHHSLARLREPSVARRPAADVRHVLDGRKDAFGPLRIASEQLACCGEGGLKQAARHALLQISWRCMLMIRRSHHA